MAGRSIAGSFLGGGWLRLLLNPYTFLAIGLMVSHGWAYHRGKVNERLNQARAIVALNKDLKSWQRAYQDADELAEKRLQIALEQWRKRSVPGTVVSASCKLPANAVTVINDISGD